MISITKEGEIRRMLPLGSDLSISRHVRVARKTVANIRRMCEIVETLEDTRVTKVLDLLWTDLPMEAIVVRAGLTRFDIEMIRRYYYLQPRTADQQHKCPTCGGAMEVEVPKSAVAHYKADTRKIEPIVNKIAVSKTQELYNLIVGMVELKRLGIIRNPLFHDLALRAEDILEQSEAYNEENENS